MSIDLLYGCFQIELSVRDLDSARDFMQEVLFAGPIEERLAREIGAHFPAGGYRVDHLGCGQATFQLNEPSPALSFGGNKSVHQGFLDRIGPCVSNLNYYVDDIGHARQLLTEMGAQVLTEGPSSVVRSLSDYGPDNSRPGADERPFLFMGSRQLIGLDLEIMEPNFLHFVDQTAQRPCFMRPSAETGGQELLVQRLRLAVDDLSASYDSLVRLFTPGSCSRPYELRESPLERSFRVTVGGIELEYREPRTKQGALAQALERYGPGVVSIEFAARDLDLILKRARGTDRSGPFCDVEFLEEENREPRWLLAARELVGFNIELAPLGEADLRGIRYLPLGGSSDG
jgi:hypothetical protein